MRVQICFAHEIAQGRGAPQPARTKHDFSHVTRLRSAAERRKLACARMLFHARSE